MYSVQDGGSWVMPLIWIYLHSLLIKTHVDEELFARTASIERGIWEGCLICCIISISNYCGWKSGWSKLKGRSYKLYIFILVHSDRK